MYRGLKIGIAVPAYNEEKLIGRVIETMPDFVDLIVVVDDNSSDHTSEITQGYQASQGDRLELIRHEVNTGVGGAVCDAYQRCYEKGMDVAVVMAGDAQMDPAELPRVLDPIVEGKADYVKGNRLANKDVAKIMPTNRLFGNHVLSLMTKIASGYWHIADSQGGYTALSRTAISSLDLTKIASNYWFENSMLIHLNVLRQRVVNVPVSAIYGIGEKSDIKVFQVAIQMSWYLLKAFFWRIYKKYLIYDFHPIFLFYISGLLLAIPGFLFGLYLVIYRLSGGLVAATSALFAVFLTVTGWQLLLFAMWLDMEIGQRGG
jgi:glycosyltransferase involved in cell wall biosynthesis